MRLRVVVALVLLVFVAGLASAEVVTYTFEGTVDSIVVSWGLPPPWSDYTVFVDAPVVGSFAYDTDTNVYDLLSVEPPDVYATDTTPLQVMDLKFSAGDFPVSPSANMGDAVSGQMVVTDWPAGVGTDCVSVGLYAVSSSEPYPIRRARLFLSDSTGAWSLQPGELLPTQLSLADFTSAAGEYVVQDKVYLAEARLGFSIDSLSLVVASPEEQLVDLDCYIVDQVALGPESVDPELETPLLSKVGAALAALARGNANDAKVAMNDLKALVNQVEAQRDHKIDSAVADAIIEQANGIIASLGA